jgi:hypothetical protein
MEIKSIFFFNLQNILYFSILNIILIIKFGFWKITSIQKNNNNKLFLV